MTPFFVGTQKLIKKTLWKNNVLEIIMVLRFSGKKNFFSYGGRDFTMQVAEEVTGEAKWKSKSIRGGQGRRYKVAVPQQDPREGPLV